MHDRNPVDTGPHPIPEDAAASRPYLCLSSRVQVDFGALSHVGKVRKNNEDHYLVGRLGRSMEAVSTNVPPELLPGRVEEFGYGMLVADGMGGAAAGEVASRTAISLLIDMVVDAAKWGRRIDQDEARALMKRMADFYNAIHSTLMQQGEFDPSLSGMGTTLTVAYSLCCDLFIAHVGDSRAYLFRGENLYQLTRDHTVAQELADRGQIPPEAVARHRYRHILTNVLGGHSGQVETQFQMFKLVDRDRLLLCSDGLSDMVDDAAIAGVLRGVEDSQAACRALLDLALEAGGKDNITIILARYSFAKDPARPMAAAAATAPQA